MSPKSLNKMIISLLIRKKENKTKKFIIDLLQKLKTVCKLREKSSSTSKLIIF